MTEPVDLSENSIDRLASKLGEQIPRGSGGTLDIDKLGSVLSNAINNLGDKLGLNIRALKDVPQVAAGVATAGDPNKAFETAVNNALSKLPDSVDKFTGSVKFLVTELVRLREDGIKMANQGNIGQGNVPGTRAQAVAAGYDNLDDAIKAINDSKNQLKGTGETYAQSSDNFLKYAAELRKDPAIKTMIEKGIIQDRDLPKLAQIAAAGRQNLTDKDGNIDKGFVDATGRLAIELNRQVGAYGLNREAVLQNMQANSNSAEDQLRMQALRSDAERDNVKLLKVKAAAQGEEIQNIIAALATGQRLTKQQQIMLQMATGGRSGQLRSAVRQMQRTAGLAKDDPARIAAEERYQRELANMNTAQNKQRFAQIGLNTADPEVRNAIQKLQESNQAKPSQGYTQRQTGLSPENAMRRQFAEADQNMLGYKQESVRRPDQAKIPNPEAETLSFISSIASNARQNAVAANLAFADFNKTLGQTPEKLKPIREFFEGVFGKEGETAAQKKEKYDQFLQPILDRLGSKKEGGSNNETGVNERRSNPRIDASNGRVDINNPASVNLGTGVEDRRRSNNPTDETRGKGTLGETGAPFEAKDVVAQLHKGETVLNPAQLSNLISGTTSKAFDNITASISTIADKSNIKTDIETVSGGNTTTRKSGQSDAEAKKVELLQEQYQQDRTNLIAKIREALGPDASGAEVLKQARAVDTGPSPESFLPSITESFKDLVPKQEEPEETKNEEPDFKPMEFSEPEVGIKDLHQELIQLNTNIRQLIDHSADMADSASRQIKATESLSGNRFA